MFEKRIKIQSKEEALKKIESNINSMSKYLGPFLGNYNILVWKCYCFFWVDCSFDICVSLFSCHEERGQLVKLRSLSLSIKAEEILFHSA